MRWPQPAAIGTTTEKLTEISLVSVTIRMRSGARQSQQLSEEPSRWASRSEAENERQASRFLTQLQTDRCIHGTGDRRDKGGRGHEPFDATDDRNVARPSPGLTVRGGEAGDHHRGPSPGVSPAYRGYGDCAGQSLR